MLGTAVPCVPPGPQEGRLEDISDGLSLERSVLAVGLHPEGPLFPVYK